MKNTNDYTYQDWLELSNQQKRKIINGWSGHEKRRHPIQDYLLEAFRNKYSSLISELLVVDFGFFGWDLPCIYLIVKNSSTRIPEYFEELLVNKGVIQEKLSKNHLIIRWRYGGSKNLVEIKDSKMISLGRYKENDQDRKLP